MKNTLLFFALLLIHTLCSAQVKFTIDDLNYQTINTNEVEVTGGNTQSTLNIPSTVTYNKKTYKVVRIAAKAFYNNDKIIYVDIANNVKSIGQQAFYDCDNILSVKLPENIEYIGKSTFYSCNCLTMITLPKTLISIGGLAFYACPIRIVYSKIENPQYVAINNNSFSDYNYSWSYNKLRLFVPKGTKYLYKSTSVLNKFLRNHVKWHQIGVT